MLQGRDICHFSGGRVMDWKHLNLKEVSTNRPSQKTPYKGSQPFNTEETPHKTLIQLLIKLFGLSWFLRTTNCHVFRCLYSSLLTLSQRAGLKSNMRAESIRIKTMNPEVKT